MTCEQCKYITVCMAQADCLGQIFDPNYDGEHGCTDFAPCTNADRIRAMSDDELTDFLNHWADFKAWKRDPGATKEWLQQPAEGG